jgi:hypothetical protein
MGHFTGFKIRGALVFLCPKEGEERRETRDELARDERRETREERQETRDERARDERREKRDKRRETRDERARDERRVSDRIKVRAIIFLNCLGQNKKNPRNSQERAV